MNSEQLQEMLKTEEEILKQFIKMQKKCQMIEKYEDPGMKTIQIIERMTLIESSIKQLGMFSPNETLKQIHTENMRLLVLPYHIGYLFGKLSYPRKQSLIQSKNYLIAFLQLCAHFNTEEEMLFPVQIHKIWKGLQNAHKNNQSFKIQRQQLILSQKQKRVIKSRYENAQKIKEQSDQRQSVKDFLCLQIYEAVSQLRIIEEQFKILEYKDSLAKDPVLAAKQKEESEKPVEKMKIWQIKKSEEIHQCMMPPAHFAKNKVQKIAQVWQQNPNKPTITLEEVAQMEIDNAMQRQARQKKYREENKEDTDSDKEDVDNRKKKKAREWDDWKDENQKGAGNRNR